MEELYSIMEDLLELEYKQEAYIQILKALELSYSQQEEQKNMKMLVSSSRWQIEDYAKDLRQIIGKLDDYIVRNAVLRK